MENKPTKENTYINNNLSFGEICRAADNQKYEFFAWNDLIYKVVWNEHFSGGPGGRHMNMTIKDLD